MSGGSVNLLTMPRGLLEACYIACLLVRFAFPPIPLTPSPPSTNHIEALA